MAINISVLGLILSSYPYLRSAMVRYPSILYNFGDLKLRDCTGLALIRAVG